MNEHLEKRHKSLKRKLVSNSRAILLGHITMPHGCLKMQRIILWIEQIKPITEINLEVFNEYNEQTSNYPVAEDRLHYNAKYLAELDIKLNEVNSLFKNKIEEKCKEIIAKFSMGK